MIHPSGMFWHSRGCGRRRDNVSMVPNLFICSKLGQQCQLGEPGLGFCSWVCCAQFFIAKNVYISKYSRLISIRAFLVAQEQQEWVDGSR
jgi:hypothetical protein